MRLDFFAAWRLCERNQGIPPQFCGTGTQPPFQETVPMHIGRELPQFRLGALSADRQAFREEKRMARKAAKASGRQARSERTTSGRQARGKEWLDFFAAWRLCERKEKDSRLPQAGTSYLICFLILKKKKKKSA